MSTSNRPSPAPPPFLRVHPQGVLLSLKVQPRASVTELGEILGAELKLKVTAPPVDSAANEAVLRFLADRLNLPKGAVQLIRGQTSRHKQILITGMPIDAVAQALGSGSR